MNFLTNYMCKELFRLNCKITADALLIFIIFVFSIPEFPATIPQLDFTQQNNLPLLPSTQFIKSQNFGVWGSRLVWIEFFSLSERWWFLTSRSWQKFLQLEHELSSGNVKNQSWMHTPCSYIVKKVTPFMKTYPAKTQILFAPTMAIHWWVLSSLSPWRLFQYSLSHQFCPFNHVSLQ